MLHLKRQLKTFYSAIIKTVYRNSSIEKHILENLQIDESEIETLYADYKHEFDTLDWKKICIFEHHLAETVFTVTRIPMFNKRQAF